MARIDVHVRDAATGLPLGGAEVAAFLLWNPDGSSFDAGARCEVLRGATDDRGTCRLAAPLGPDEVVEHRLVVRARGHREWRGPRFRRQDPRPEPEVLTGDDAVVREVALERGPTLAGRVTDGAGHPVSGVALGLVLSHARGCSWPHAFGVTRDVRWPPSVETDDDGRFEWLSFPAEAAGRSGAHFVLLAAHDDYATAMVHRVETLPSDVDGVIWLPIRLARGVTLTGRALSAAGAPARNATVRTTPDPLPDQPACVRLDRTATTDDAGRFVLRGLPSRPHDVEVAASGCRPSSGRSDLSGGDGDMGDVLLIAGCDLEGRVVDRESSPVPGLDVLATMEDPRMFRRAVTDAEGRFRVEGLPPSGRVTLRCGTLASTEVELPSPPVTVRAAALVDLVVRLVADESDEPILGLAHVTALGPGFSMLLQRTPSGTHRRDGVPAGRYELRASVPDRRSASAVVDLREGAPRAPVVIRMSWGGAVRGRVRDGAGTPRGGVRVTVLDAGPAFERRTTTLEDGAFEVRGLGDRAYLIFASPDFATHGLVLRATGSVDAPADVSVVLGVGASVRGLVRRGGDPVARAHVTVVPSDRADRPYELPSTLSDESGLFLLEHVPEGDFVVTTDGAEVAIRSSHGAALEVSLTVPSPRGT